MGLRLLLVTALVSIIVFVTIPTFLHFRPEDPAIDDSDLRIARAELAEGANGLLRLRALAARLSWPEDGDDTIKELLEAAPLDARRAEAFLAPHQNALEEAAAIATLATYQVPPAALGESTIGTEFLRITRCLALRARLRSASGDIDGALADLELVLELARRVRTARGVDLVAGATAIAAAKPALDAMPEIAARAQLDAAATLAATRRWARSRTTQETWRAVWQGEYETMARTMDGIAAGAPAARYDVIAELAEELPTGAYHFQPNATKALFADYYRALQAGTGVPCDALEIPEVEMPTQPLMFLGIFAGANAVGEILFSVAAIDVRRYERRRCDHDTKLAAGRILLALHAYHRDHGAWPGALDALVPAYLDAVPLDGSEGRPLYYDPERAVLAAFQVVDREVRLWELAN